MKDFMVDDVVKYYNGTRIYRITEMSKDGSILHLDCSYQAKKDQIIRLNNLRIHNRMRIEIMGVVITAEIIKLRFNQSGNIEYGLRNLENGVNIEGWYPEGKLLSLIKQTNENENRLQKQEAAQRDRNISGASRELCCGNSLCFELGHRGYEYRVDQSQKRAQHCYDGLSLGQQEVPRSQGEGGRLREGTQVAQRSQRSIPDGLTNDLLDVLGEL